GRAADVAVLIVQRLPQLRLCRRGQFAEAPQRLGSGGPHAGVVILRRAVRRERRWIPRRRDSPALGVRPQQLPDRRDRGRAGRAYRRTRKQVGDARLWLARENRLGQRRHRGRRFFAVLRQEAGQRPRDVTVGRADQRDERGHDLLRVARREPPEDSYRPPADELVLVV